jgi:hypothetical protein
MPMTVNIEDDLIEPHNKFSIGFQIYKTSSKEYDSYLRFIDYLTFFDQFLQKIQIPKLLDQILKTLFNNFLIKVVQPLLLENTNLKLARTVTQVIHN